MNEIKLIKRLFEKHKNEENAFHMEKLKVLIQYPEYSVLGVDNGKGKF